MNPALNSLQSPLLSTRYPRRCQRDPSAYYVKPDSPGNTHMPKHRNTFLNKTFHTPPPPDMGMGYRAALYTRRDRAQYPSEKSGRPVARRSGPQRISFAFFMYLGVAVARKSDAAYVGTCMYFFSKGSFRCRPSRRPPQRAPNTLPRMFLSGRSVAGVSSSNRALFILSSFVELKIWLGLKLCRRSPGSDNGSR